MKFEYYCLGSILTDYSFKLMYVVFFNSNFYKKSKVHHINGEIKNNARMLTSCKRLKNIQVGVSTFFFLETFCKLFFGPLLSYEASVSLAP